MASNNEAKVKFTAETSEFNANIKSANSEISSIKSELTLAAAEFKNTGDSAEYMQTKHDLLTSALEANAEKQENLNAKIEVATQYFGENSDEVSKLEQQLTKAKIEEQNLTSQLNDTNDALDTQAALAGEAGTKLSEANDSIADADDKLSSLSDQLKTASDEYANTGDKAEYLQTKHDLLESSIEANQQKQEALNDAIEAAASIYGENSTEVQNLQSQLASARDEEADLESQLSDTNDEIGNQKSGFETLKDALVAGGVITAIKEVGTALYDLATEADDSRAIIVQGTGATGEALESLCSSAQTAFADISLSSSTSLSDVSETLAELNTRFGLTGEDLEELTVTMQDFATVTGQDGASAVDSIADIMSYWGLEMDDLPALLDDITTASQGCKASASELEDALYTNAGAFESLGYSTEEALAFLTTYSANGGEVSEVSGLMTKAISNLSDATDDVPGAFQAAIEAIAECDTTAEALQAQVGDTGLTVEEVFGTKNAQKLAQNIQSGTTSIEDWTAALEDNQGALDQTVEDSTTMSDSIATSMNTIKTNASEIFSPAISDIVSGLADATTAAADYVAESDGDLLGALGAFAGSIADDVLPALADFASDLGGDVITALGTLSTTTGEKLGEVKDFFDEKFDAASEKASTVLSDVAGWFTEHLGTADSETETNLTSVSDFFTEKFDAISEKSSGVLSDVAGWFTEHLGTANTETDTNLSSVSDFFTTNMDSASEKVSTVLSDVSGWFSEHLGASSSTTDTEMSSIKTSFTDNMKNAKTTVSTRLGDIKTAFSNKLGSAKTTVSSKMTGIYNSIKEKMGDSETKVSSVVDSIAGFFSEAKFEWPSIALPHFSISPSGWQIGDLLKGSIPSLGITWYAEGAVLDGATIFGMSGGNLLGGGEAGPEAVAPIDVLQDYVSTAVESAIGDSMTVLADAIEALAARPVDLYINGQKFANATTSNYDAAMGSRQNLAARGLSLA